MLHLIQRLLLHYARRRFRAYRAISRRETLVCRSLLIEDTRQQRFFEVGYDETPSYDDFADVDSAILERIVDLSDTLICISRLSFDAFSFRRIRGFNGGKSLEEALQIGSSRRRVFEELVHAAAKPDDESDPPSPGVVIDNDEANANVHQPKGKTLRPAITLSLSNPSDSINNMIRELSAELRAKTGSENVRWRMASKHEDGRDVSEH